MMMPSPPSGSGAPGRLPRPSFRELSRTFWRGISSTQHLGPAIEGVLQEFNAHLGTRRASVWLHNRRARELSLLASSDPAYAASRVSIADPGMPAARGLRLDQAQILPRDDAAAEPILISPLRGWRRALGTLVIEGRAPEYDDQQQLDLSNELGRQLSAGIENVQLLEDMLRQRRLLEDTFNSLLDPVVVTDGALRVVQMNDAFAVRLGRPRAELLERSLSELVGSDLASWAGREPEVAGGPEPAGERLPEPAGERLPEPAGERLPKPTGERPTESDRAADQDAGVRMRTIEVAPLGGLFAVTLTPLINEDGEPVGTVLVARDITRQTRLEADQEALRARLAQSEKLASLGQFVAGIAHEINNPLQGVLGHLELLITAPGFADSTAPPDPRTLRKDLRRIYHEADRAAKIVQNLLTFTGSQRKARRRVRIDRVLTRALATRKTALARAGIEVVRQHGEDVPPVLGDPLLLQQAFLNVLINAEHAIVGTGQPGSIAISTQSSDQRRRVLTTVRDTGTGIALTVLPRIFDPFFTTKDVGQGTGLGLAITYGIIQEHGGTIHAANAPEGGAIFTIELPAEQKP
jgi:signal transduction histidine kinase